MSKFRVCQLDGCDVWCVQRLHAPKWWARWFVEPRWIQTRRYNLFDPCYSEPEEFETRDAALVKMTKLETWDREAAARDRKSWRCGS